MIHNIETHCGLCGFQEETLDHLLLHYPHSLIGSATAWDSQIQRYSGGKSRKTNYCLGVVNGLPEDIVVDILSRLPVKSLMRFKSVSKHWLSLIKQDQHFIDLHFKRSKSRPNLLHINTGTKSLQQSISFAEIVEGSGGKVITSKVRITDNKWFIYSQVLEPVNGLVCFVDWKAYAIRVYNPSTREATPWVKSTLLAEATDKLQNEDSTLQIKRLRNAIYRFGFDPEKKEHKVFCFWRLVARRHRHIPGSMERPGCESWEAFTVGRDVTWRKISVVPNEYNQIKIKDALPSPSSSPRHVYADGTIYWSNKEYAWEICRYTNPDDPAAIVALDVGSEKYRVIPIPNFIFDEPRDVRLPIGMLVLGGHPALLFRMKPWVVKIWVLDDGADKKLENCRGNISNWSTETITLPFYGTDNWVDGVGIAGSTNKILFECQGHKDKVGFTCFCLYDGREKSCKKMELDGVSSFTHIHFGMSLLSTFTESLYPCSISV